MSLVLRLPEVLTGMEEATLTSWHVAVGQEVRAGQPLADVETEKATVEYLADASGIVAAHLVELEQSVTVGSPLVLLATDGESVDDARASVDWNGAAVSGSDATAPRTNATRAAGDADLATERHAQNPPQVDGRADAPRRNVLTAPEPEHQPSSAGGRVRATPLVRRLAAQHGIHLADVPGTGPRGRIVRRDIDRLLPDRNDRTAAVDALAGRDPRGRSASEPAIEATPSGRTAATAEAPARGSGIAHSKMRRAIARRLTESKSTVPHFYLTAHCRVDALLELRQRVNAEAGIRVSVNDFLIKAVAGALQDVPAMNAMWTDTEAIQFETVDIAVAVALENGLVTPVVRSVESRSLSDISRTVSDLVARARSGTLRQVDLEGGSFSISNLGMYGTEQFAAIINPPHAGILAVGAATQRPVVSAGAVEVGTVMTVTLSGDHRIVDGATGAQWLAAFVRRIENPLQTLV